MSMFEVLKRYFSIDSIFNKIKEDDSFSDWSLACTSWRVLGDITIGRSMVDGKVLFNDKKFSFQNFNSEFLQQNPSLVDFMLSFDWLRDVEAVGTFEASKIAYKHIYQWLNLSEDIERHIPPIMYSKQCFNMISIYDFIKIHGDSIFNSKFFSYIDKLEEQLDKSKKFIDNAYAISSWCLGQISIEKFKYGTKHKSDSFEFFKNKLLSLNPVFDIHCPQQLQALLLNIIEIDHNVDDSYTQEKEFLNSVIESITPVLKTYLHQDNSFHNLNRTVYHNYHIADIKKILSFTKTKINKFSKIPDRVFYNSSTNNTTLLISAHEGHINFSSFELSNEGSLLFTSHHAQEGSYLNGLSFDSRKVGITSQNHSFDMFEDKTSFTAEVSLQQGRNKYFYRRNLFFSSDKNYIEGKDSLTVKEGALSANPVITFYVAEGIKTYLGNDRKTVILQSGDKKWALESKTNLFINRLEVLDFDNTKYYITQILFHLSSYKPHEWYIKLVGGDEEKKEEEINNTTSFKERNIIVTKKSNDIKQVKKSSYNSSNVVEESLHHNTNYFSKLNEEITHLKINSPEFNNSSKVISFNEIYNKKFANISNEEVMKFYPTIGYEDSSKGGVSNKQSVGTSTTRGEFMKPFNYNNYSVKSNIKNNVSSDEANLDVNLDDGTANINVVGKSESVEDDTSDKDIFSLPRVNESFDVRIFKNNNVEPEKSYGVDAYRDEFFNALYEKKRSSKK